MHSEVLYGLATTALTSIFLLAYFPFFYLKNLKNESRLLKSQRIPSVSPSVRPSVRLSVRPSVGVYVYSKTKRARVFKFSVMVWYCYGKNPIALDNIGPAVRGPPIQALFFVGEYLRK